METAGNVLLRSIKVSRHLKIQGFKQPDAHPGVISLTCSQAKGLSQTFKRAKIRRQQQFYFIDGPWIPLRLLATDLLGTSRSECFENCTSAHLEDLTNLCWSAPFRCWAQQSQGNNLLISVASGFLYRWQGAPWGMLQLPPSLFCIFCRCLVENLSFTPAYPPRLRAPLNDLRRCWQETSTSRIWIYI